MVIIMFFSMYFLINSLDSRKKYYMVDSKWVNCIGTLVYLDHGGTGGKVVLVIHTMERNI